MGLFDRITEFFKSSSVRRGEAIYEIEWSSFYEDWSTSFSVGNHFKGDTHMWYSSDNVEMTDGYVKLTSTYNPNKIEDEVYEYSVGMLHSIKTFNDGVFDFKLYKPADKHNAPKLLFVSEETLDFTNILEYVSVDNFTVIVDKGFAKVIENGKVVSKFAVEKDFMVVLANTLTRDIEDKIVVSDPMTLFSLNVYEIQ